MKATIAIKRFLEEGEHGEVTGSGDLLALKKASTPEEWRQYGQDAATALGVELDKEGEL